MFTILMFFRRASWLGKVFIIALLVFVFITTIVRVVKATHQIQEKQQHVHTRRNPR